MYIPYKLTSLYVTERNTANVGVKHQSINRNRKFY